MVINETSKTQYVYVYKYLVKKAETTDLKKILDFIKTSNVKDRTKLTYLNSIIGLKRNEPNMIKGNINEMLVMRDIISQKVETSVKDNNLTDNQKDVLESIKISDIDNLIEKLKANKNTDMHSLETYILLKLIFKYKIRNDLMEIKLMHKKKLNSEDNTLYIPIKKSDVGILRLNKYKTARSKGPVEFEIDAETMKDIRKLILFDGREYLFVNGKKKPLSSSLFTHKLYKIFSDEFGKRFSTTTLRKLYATEKFGGMLNEMKETAEMMGHSLGTHQKIYISNQ